jgi:membrane-associated protease RseP (regulator of RpoE activity)
MEDQFMAQTTNYHRQKLLFSILAVLVFFWGVSGALDITNVPYHGIALSPGNVITAVREGSPAAQAGAQVGDTLTKLDNIPIEDFATFVNRERPAIGSDGSVTVNRGGIEQTLNFKYAAQPFAEIVATSGSGIVIGLAFLILGLMVYLKHPTYLSRSFCALSLLFAMAVFPVPYLASSVERRIVFAILSLLGGIMIATVLNYCLHYPHAKAILTARPWLQQAIFIFAPALGLMLATINLTTPPMSATRSLLLTIGIFIVYGGYLLLSVIGVGHSFFTASAEQRSATGLNLMLVGLVVGFGPLLLTILVRLFSPNAAELPGERFNLLPMVAIPICLALALMKLEPAPAAVQAEERPTT